MENVGRESTTKSRHYRHDWLCQCLTTASTDGAATDHNIRLIGLEPYTEYSFQVRSTDEYQITGESKNYTFKTKASLPDIRNLRIVKVEENAATLAWDTTVPAKALIEYQDLTTGAQNSLGRPTLATTHQMRITDLTLGTRYVAFVIAENSEQVIVRSGSYFDRSGKYITNTSFVFLKYPEKS